MEEEASGGASRTYEEEQEDICESPASPWHDRLWNMQDEADTGKLAEEHAERLQLASTVLLDRLFEYLSHLPSEEESIERALGLTLPASAVGWLATQLYPRVDSLMDDDRPNDHALWMGSSMRDRLALLKFLLTRITHVRVTSEEWPPNRPETSTLSTQHQDFVGQYMDPDAMSVHSTLTVESAVPPRPSLRSFLYQCYLLQNRPRVDLRLFPSLNVLLLDRVPPEWVVNLRVVRDSLELLRTERACVYNLTDFLFPNGYAEVASDGTLPVFRRLTHFKLQNCAIGELSGLRGEQVETGDEICNQDVDKNDVLAPTTAAQTKLMVPPPLSRLPNLVSLSLAHNDIRSTRTALAGLSSLPLLRRLDLSYNYLTSMRGANAMLGNIKVLILTGNRIRTVQGLDRLYSLEKLSLDRNNLKDLASVAGLAKLPELQSLKLVGNPVAEFAPRKYRVEVLNLFREERFGGLPSDATYRQLLGELPILDGMPASKAELVGLRGFAFSQMVGLAENDSAPERDENNTETSMLTTSTDGESPEYLSIMPPPVRVTKRPNRVSRRGKPRRIVIEDGPAANRIELHGSVGEESTEVVFLKDDSDIVKNVRFSLTDLVATLPRLAPPVLENDAKADMHIEREVDTEWNKSETSNQGAPRPSDPGASALDGTCADLSTRTCLQRQDFPDQAKGLSFISLSPVMKDGSMQVSMARETSVVASVGFESQTNPQSPSHRGGEDQWTSSDDGNGIELGNGEIPKKPTSPSQSEKKSVNLSTYDPCASTKDNGGPPTESVRYQTQFQLMECPDVSNSDVDLSEHAYHLGAILPQVPEVVFPDYVWEEDENSVLSSIKTNAVDTSSQSKYQEAEEESIYDGLDHLKGLPVLTNLELYFRCFVFRVSMFDKLSFPDEPSENEKLKLMLDLAPRIQLRPVDWRALESTARSLSTMEIYSIMERFDGVWREEALACGKLAAKRLTPHRKPKRGFHGDVLFSNGKLAKTCECRSLIVCTSDAAIYFMSDYDAVSRHQLSKAGKRRFPMPIPEESLFQNAPWPHAIARHPILTLDRITIGFGFQRLSLHFRPERGSPGESSEEFTYIVITCNKLRTVNLLQHLQSLAKDFASRPSNQTSSKDLTIDNDDKQVLDALAEAVAPSTIGMVLHYQIVQQRWQHGDRGTVRRACIVTDSHLYLLDEDYVGDGSESFEAGAGQRLGEVCFKMVDDSAIDQVSEVQAGLDDPNSVTVVIKPLSRLQRYHRWRLVCKDREGAERLVEDIRKAMAEEPFGY